MLKHVRIVIGVVLWSICFSAQGQSTFENIVIGACGSYSSFMAHRPNLKGYPNAHFGMFEASVGKQANGTKLWHRDYHFPEAGIGAFYSNVGHNKYTGDMFSAYAYIKFPYVRFSKSGFNFRLGLGPGWVENKFDRTHNYKNLVSGTHLNAAIFLSNSYNYQINPNHKISIGLNLVHFSNGAFRLPNLGVNLLGLGFAYQFQKSQHVYSLTDSLIPVHKVYYSLSYSVGLKEVYPVLGKQYFVSNLSFTGLYRYSTKAGLGLLFDFFDDSSVNHQMKFDSDSSNNHKSNLQAGVGAVYEVMIGKLSIPLAVGFYAYNNYKEIPFMYLKMGISYYLTKNINLNFTLKSHYAKADFFAYGLGYRF